MAIDFEQETKKYAKAVDEVLYPEIEPGIINRAMIDDSYLTDEYKGECARLHQMEPIVYDRIERIRLEAKNILRIDHLWVLPNLTKLSLNRNKIEKIENLDILVNLKELDLSFNFIEKIENLDKLHKLEILGLFHNQITKIENLEVLENLIILSIGDNLIRSVEGIERFRFMKKLKVLNLEGNPLGRKSDFNLAQYVMAILPDLKYYEYVLIKESDRVEARKRFSRELREIETIQEQELVERAKAERERIDAERLASSFVEHLNAHQLFESLWEGDDDGHAMLTIGPLANNLVEEYDNDIYQITQELYKFGLSCYEERETEIQEFVGNLEEGQMENQQMGQKIVEEFLVYKDSLFEKATEVAKALELRIIRGEDEFSPVSLEYADEFDNVLTEFDQKVERVWQRLMAQELHLHEAIQEALTNFQRSIQELMSKFVEHAQGMFALLREIALHFSENLAELVSRFIAEKLALRDFDTVPQELKHCLEDRDAIINMIAGMKEAHTLRIDEREDRLMTRSREFIEDLISTLANNELDRNRRKILEVNSFLETMTENLANLRTEVREQLMEEES